jgi:hypothetical protein
MGEEGDKKLRWCMRDVMSKEINKEGGSDDDDHKRNRKPDGMA